VAPRETNGGGMAVRKTRGRGTARRTVVMANGFVALALLLAGCFAGSDVPAEYRPMLDKMEHSIPSITRVGRESSGGGSCTPDGETYPFVERRYRPGAGVSMLEAQRAIHDYFVQHGFPDDGGEFGPRPDNLDWALFGDPDSTQLSVTNEDQQGTPTDLITVKLESNTC
jgi:hypothetical protein